MNMLNVKAVGELVCVLLRPRVGARGLTLNVEKEHKLYKILCMVVPGKRCGLLMGPYCCKGGFNAVTRTVVSNLEYRCVCHNLILNLKFVY